MNLYIILAMLCGVGIGLTAAAVFLRAGLTRREWLYLVSFYRAVREGRYEERPGIPDDEKEDGHESD